MARPSAERIDPPDPKRFVWPPRRGVPIATAAAPIQASTARPRPGAAPVRRSAWSEFESAFLDVTAAPLPLRAFDAGWMADGSDGYCPRCGRTLGATPAPPDGCDECAGVRFAWDRMVRLGEYTGPLRTWVHEVKFTRWRRLGFDLGQRLGHSLLEAWIRRPDASRACPVVVPVPDHPLRRVWRGIDHTAVIAAGVVRATGWPLWQPLQRRLGRSQLSLPASERAANVARSFGIRRVLPPLGGVGLVVVVDDVVTTGATMRACCRHVAKAVAAMGNVSGAEVWAACLARAERADRAAGRTRG